MGVALALIGCGEVSDKEFRSKVDGICTRSGTEVAAIPVPEPNDLSANGRYTGQVVRVVRKTHDRLAAVDAPSSKRSEYKKWVSGFQRIGEVVAKQTAAAGVGDRAGFNAFVEQQNTLLQESKAKAALLGFEQCSK